MRRFWLGFLSFVVFEPAYGDCVNPPPRQIQARLDNVSTPVFDGNKHEIRGCILHSEGRVLGYTNENRLCHAPMGKTLKILVTRGCCDTGPDFGDVECIVRSKGAHPAHGNGVTVHSATP
jgi:hypothetical protein